MCYIACENNPNDIFKGTADLDPQFDCMTKPYDNGQLAIFFAKLLIDCERVGPW